MTNNIPLEIEHKYLIKMPNIEKLASVYKVKHAQIIQTYLNQSIANRRVRAKTVNEITTYYYTEKKDITALIRTENEKIITKKEYEKYLLQADKSLNQIIKDRYFFEYDGKIIEIDIYPFWNDFAVLEVEVQNEHEKINLPKEAEVVREVTDEKAFRNFSLAKNTDIICV
ncbi:MAG: hypothetical protein R3Y35_04505 [Clostridia bacterium]